VQHPQFSERHLLDLARQAGCRLQVEDPLGVGRPEATDHQYIL
jgi:hypothetical protein